MSKQAIQNTTLTPHQMVMKNHIRFRNLQIWQVFFIVKPSLL